MTAKESLAVMQRAVGEHHPYFHTVQGTLALVYLEGGRIDEAESLLRIALPGLIATYGPDRPDHAEMYAAQGTLHVLRGQVARGIGELHRAVTLAVRSGLPDVRMQTRFALARALWDHRPEERDLALALARDAEQDAAAAGDPARGRRIAAWIAAREGK